MILAHIDLDMILIVLAIDRVGGVGEGVEIAVAT